MTFFGFLIKVILSLAVIFGAFMFVLAYCIEISNKRFLKATFKFVLLPILELFIFYLLFKFIIGIFNL